MRDCAKFLFAFVCMGLMLPCAWAQVPSTAVKALRGAKVPSALSRMDQLSRAGQRAVSAARVPLQVAPVRVSRLVTPARQQLERFIYRPIQITPVENLRPRLVSPTVAQTQDAVSQYENFFADYTALRKETDPLIGNALRENIDLTVSLHPTQVGMFSEQLRGLELRASRIQKMFFPADAALQEAADYLQFASQQVNKFYEPAVEGISHSVRPFVQDEFWMEYDWRKGPRDETLTQLPEDVHLVVLNDTKDILYMYKQWEREGRFPKGWKLSVYEDTKELLDAVEAGNKFDLIISDINVPGGGGRYFVGRLREMDRMTPVIGCSMYTRDKIDSQELHGIGFDGYMYGDDMFEETSGFYKWVGYIKNYYYYKRIGNWPR